MDKIKGCIETCKKWYGVVKSNPAKSMKILSSVSGVLLIIGGISGIVNLFNPLAAVISAYNILFGMLIVATELKSWPIIGAFQKRVDVYFHLLSVPKGKGGFYCFIGLLAFCASEWSLARICILIVAIVGIFHLLGYPREVARTEAMAAQDEQHQTGGIDTASLGVSEFALKVMSENPELVKQGLSLAAQASASQSQQPAAH